MAEQTFAGPAPAPALLEALDEILKSQPDQELWAHLNQGVNYFFPLRNQITCLAHLTTLSKCVSWQQYRHI